MDFSGDLVNQFISLIESFGYLGIFTVIALEYACFPLPSEVVLPFVGFITSKGSFSLSGSIIVSVIAGLAGSALCYALGYYGGSTIITKITRKFPSSQKSFNYINKFIKKYGKASVFFTRLLPVTRTYVSLLAGSVRMSFLQFMMYSLGGIVIWNTLLISLGYAFGENTELIGDILSKYSTIVGVIFLLGLFYYGYKKYKSKKS
ncbi:MAG: DedA family protein [Clostridium sp.]